ncbi:hypothetical protein BT96DRAFT_824146 [Gymnopus androsaceus JB14]|uniref:UbiA prenyltransferase n=1 Tax=Gymnopus androsaceus JB14 TaxID=1447944 RepID=A0A6A4HIA8_9AGAR|nr:hypothetical protein BT96DRAFT_824146 [Gymnopus androsaceus JB14]
MLSPVRLGNYFLKGVYDVLVTLFFFSKSDIKSTLIPITSFAAACAPLQSIAQLPATVVWIWIHLLQFNLANQLISVEEDRRNKPDRPLPSGRVSLPTVLAFRWILVPACFGFSALFSFQVVCSSVVFVALTVLYNECGGHAYWATRDFLNGLGFSAFEWGACLIAGPDQTKLTDVALRAVYIGFPLFATTIHCQDFKDIQGDTLLNRQTLPIFLPAASRYIILTALTMWSLTLAWLWELPVSISAAFIGLGLYVGARFLMQKTKHEDQVSYYWYNVWLSAAHALPAIKLLRSIL